LFFEFDYVSCTSTRIHSGDDERDAPCGLILPAFDGREDGTQGWLTPLPQLDFAKVEENDVNILKRTFPGFPLHRAISKKVSAPTEFDLYRARRALRYVNATAQRSLKLRADELQVHGPK